MNTSNPTQPHRVLVIDDNPAIHEDFRKILCADGDSDLVMERTETVLFGESSDSENAPVFEIDSAFQGQEGLEKVRQAVKAGRPYAVAFVDIRMPPGWDGVETIKHIWQVAPDLQVVICTAYSDYSWRTIIENLGESDNLVILKKPFDNIEVLQLAHALAKKWGLDRQVKCRIEQLAGWVNLRTQELQAANVRLERENAQHQETEKALRLSEERFSKAFRSNPLPMLIYSLSNEQCLDANAQFLTMLDFPPPDVIGRSLAELQVLPDEARWSRMREQLQRFRSARNWEYAFRTRSGALRQTLLWAELIEVAAEPCVLLIVEDVTERRDLEEQLHQAQKMEAMGQLASGIAHDLNNILTVVQGHVELLLAANNIEPQAANSLKQVALASSRAAGLTRQLLTFSRKQAVQPKVLSLSNEVQSLKGMLARLIGEHIQLQCECAQNLPRILADPCNLEQIIMNLVVNARDAMPRGGTLTIKAAAIQIDESRRRHPAARPGQYVCLSVADTGCGIRPEILSRIFEPFFTTKEVGQGTGLGLATVYGIVKQLNGWIEVESVLGKGSNFIVYLPPFHHPQSPPDAEPASIRVQPGSATILVVEDEKSVRELTCHVIGGAGYQVVPAADGVEALKLWAENRSRIDLLFTDIVMPNGINGRDLARKLQSEKPDLKVLYTSGYSEELTGKDSLLAAGNKFVAKPFRPGALLHAVAECLSSTTTTTAPAAPAAPSAPQPAEQVA